MKKRKERKKAKRGRGRGDKNCLGSLLSLMEPEPPGGALVFLFDLFSVIQSVASGLGGLFARYRAELLSAD